MSDLNLEPAIADPDAIYDLLVAMHAGLSTEESAIVNNRLILLLINQIGDETVIRAAIRAARGQRDRS